MLEWAYERDLEFDFFPTQRGRDGQCRDLDEGLGKLGQSLHERRAIERPLSCCAPKACRFLDLPGLGAVTRQQFWLTLGDLREPALKRLGDASVKRPSRLAQ